MIYHPISVSVKHVCNTFETTKQKFVSRPDPGVFPGLASGDAFEGCQIAWKGTGHGMPQVQ